MHIARVLSVDSHGPLREGRQQERPLMKAAEHLMPADESRPLGARSRALSSEGRGKDTEG